jgi:hypothetical protein
MKTGLDAAQHYFKDNLTEAYRRRDPHGWNLSHGLAFVAESLQWIEHRLDRLEKALTPQDANPPRRR